MDTPEIDYPKLASTFLASFRTHAKEGNLQLIVDRTRFKKFGGPTPARLYSKVTETSGRLADSIPLKQRFTLDAEEMQRGQIEAWEQIHDAYDGMLAQIPITVDPPNLDAFLQELEGLECDEISKCPFELLVHVGPLLTAANCMLGNIYPETFINKLLPAEPEPTRWKHREFT